MEVKVLADSHEKKYDINDTSINELSQIRLQKIVLVSKTRESMSDISHHQREEIWDCHLGNKVKYQTYRRPKEDEISKPAVFGSFWFLVWLP